MAKRVKARLNRPATDEMFTRDTTDDVLYEAMTDAQDEEIQYLAPRVPSAVNTGAVQMTTGDSGATFTFGADADTASIIAIGHFELYAAQADIPDSPLEEGTDYIVEDDNIRILPYGSTRSPAPYAVFVKPGNVIAAATQPTLPKVCRQALISNTCARLAADRLKQDPRSYLETLARERSSYCLALKTRSAQAGGSVSSGRRRVIRWPGMGN